MMKLTRYDPPAQDPSAGNSHVATFQQLYYDSFISFIY